MSLSRTALTCCLPLLLARCACPDVRGGGRGDGGVDESDGGPDVDGDGGVDADAGVFGDCQDGDGCDNDRGCIDGVCVPYADGENDAACSTGVSIDALVPEVQCAFSEPPPGDPFPDNNQVMSTPVVVDLNLDNNVATLRPSVIFTTFAVAGSYGTPGVLRVIDGATCEQQMVAAGVQAMSPAGPAVGDLTGDGRAEIVIASDDPASPGGLVALQVDTATTTLQVLWRSADCSSGARVPDNTGGRDQWTGPSLFDLDDDGVPEILYGQSVYDAQGCLLTPPAFPAYSRGVMPLAVDVDEDGRVELVAGDSLLEWDSATSSWLPDPTFVANAQTILGQVAVADFGAFPIAALGGADVAEVAVVSDGFVRVQTVAGDVVFGPFAIAGGGRGGAPTVADFDGDGRVEVAAAAAAAYAVYDLDCVAGGDVAGCASGSTDGVLWSQPVQDLSSNVTGSSIFDFDADGQAEVVYADECYLRIFDGGSGAVLFSAARSSGTTYENPVIVDVDGDFKTEIVTSANDYAGINCGASDPLSPTTPYAPNHGIVVLRDAEDRWAASRPVWNQHAYFVTHTDDRGVVPRTSQQALNWRTPGLNNFRQNVQGDLDATGAGDLTARGDDSGVRLVCVDGVATFAANVCNRGTLPLGAGSVVAFVVGGAEQCRAQTAGTLDVGACTAVSCQGPAPSAAVDVTLVVDPDNSERECYEGNNQGVLAGATCLDVGG